MNIKISEIHSVREKLSVSTTDNKIALRHHKYVADWINSLSNESDLVLEVGCGNCVLRNYLHSRYFGIDPIKHKDLDDNDFFSYGSGESMPFTAGYFNFVVIKDAINYFENIEIVFKEASRVLGDKGVFLITEMVGENFSPITQVAKNFLKKYLKIRKNIWDSTYLNWYSVYFLRALGNRIGFFSEFKYIKSESRYYIIFRK